MLNDNMKKKLTKSAVTGGILTIATSTMYGSGTLEFMGYQVPSLIPLFLSGAGASMISDYAHDAIYPHLNTTEQKLSDVAAVAAGVGVSGVATAGILALTGVPKENLIPAVILGGGSYIAADYIESRFLEKNGMLVF